MPPGSRHDEVEAEVADDVVGTSALEMAWHAGDPIEVPRAMALAPPAVSSIRSGDLEVSCLDRFLAPVVEPDSRVDRPLSTMAAMDDPAHGADLGCGVMCCCASLRLKFGCRLLVVAT